MPAVKADRNELSRLAGGRAPKGRRGSHTHAAIMAVLFAMRRVVMAVLFPSRNDTWVGNPSGSSSHLPYKAEEFFLRTGSDGKQGI